MPDSFDYFEQSDESYDDREDDRDFDDDFPMYLEYEGAYGLSGYDDFGYDEPPDTDLYGEW